MKSETENRKLTPEEFNKTPVTKLLGTNSDGTVVAANSDPAIQVPPREFVEQMRAYSLANPEAAVAIISGRADPYLEEHYAAAFTPDEEGRVPKILLMSENGAFLRASTDPENLHVLTEPFTQEVKDKIVEITKTAAGEYFRESDQGLDPNEVSLWLDPKETTYGIFRRTPVDEGKRAIMDGILDEIKTGLEQLEQENPGLHINLGAVDAFLVEKVSKGITVNELLTGQLTDNLETAGITAGTITQMMYSGDDVTDIAAQNEVNKALESGALTAGYTTRINDYSPNFSEDQADLMTRTPPKSPKDPSAQDSFYILGDKDHSGQDQHRSYFLDNEAFEKMNSIRQNLSEIGLMPSQSGDAQTPPIVLLTNGDILIQEPERYSKESLNKLRDWDKVKVVLLANRLNALSVWQKEMALSSENVVAITSKGAAYSRGEYHDLDRSIPHFKYENQIISSNPERSEDIQALRVIQALLVNKEIIKIQEIPPIAPPETQQEIQPIEPVAAVAGLEQFARMPAATLDVPQQRRRSSRVENQAASKRLKSNKM
ncbi:hypothetical protein [Ascidiimonas sp. W6]|uniref:hypothetical protein n=1 Tax=Ascidiimonas meishanensis TaxID=3128903 RepID=UPI0030ED6B59